MTYLEVLTDEHRYIRYRIQTCDPEAIPLLQKQLKLIQRDIEHETTYSNG